ncbi:type IV secretory system conjugative DNA transfer family protein [Loktanella salsilacus]|uniref:type IV secretory system conjugative DNA transfer family protein n=1 Tax=Loktanella salsilacus TaxID=195913 RepID=UPI0037354A83
MTYAIPLGRIADHGRGSLGFGTTADVVAPGNLMTDDSDAGLVTIAGTGTGKGVSQVIPTALTYPGSMVIVDIKGEIAAVTARARCEMGQKVVTLDPFGGSPHSLNPMEAIDPLSPDAYDQAKRIAAMMRSGAVPDDPFWEDVSEMIIAGTILFLATHIPQEERALPLLHRMWGVADHLEEMLTAMKSRLLCE